MVKPFKVFAYIAITILLLTLVSLFIPPEGLRLGSVIVKYPSVRSLFSFDSVGHPSHFTLSPEIAELEMMLDSITGTTVVVDSLSVTQDSLGLTKPDSLNADAHSIITTKNERITAEILKSRLVHIEMPDSNFKALQSFYNALQNGDAIRSQVRIMHYGDSQIEGDRITSFLRSRLQSRFGGGGVGLLNAVPHSYQPGAVYQTVSSNWQYVSIADLGKGAVGNRFGIMGGYSIFKSSRRASRGGFTEAWIDLERRGSHSSLARNFTRCRMLFGHVPEPIMLSLSYQETTQDAELLAPTADSKSVSWSVPKSVRQFRLGFKGDESPMVYAISLETPTGIIVDNIAIRGSSGTDFTRSDNASLKRVMQLVKPNLIILQFGVNIVPHIVDSYTYYENQLYQQIVALKGVNPGVSVILIGVSDMSRKVNGRFESYPNIERIRDAQRNAAFRAGAAFWDCYTAMGGHNSMPAWVYASPPLASKDFVHFTLRGSNIIAEMFYSSLMESYNRFAQQNIGEVN